MSVQGAGRAALVIQERGQEVVALDPSPGALEVCRRRGVLRTFLGTIDDIPAGREPGFDTFLFLGNNLGLLGNREQALLLLHRLAALSNRGAVIVGAGLDPYQTADPVHLDYHRRNREAGRMAGQVTIWIRYRRQATAWFDLLWTSGPVTKGSLCEPPAFQPPKCRHDWDSTTTRATKSREAHRPRELCVVGVAAQRGPLAAVFMSVRSARSPQGSRRPSGRRPRLSCASSTRRCA